MSFTANLCGLDTAGNDHVLVLTHRFWQSHFGAEPGVIGRDVIVDGEARRSSRVICRRAGRRVSTP
ncbi:MAG: hypothetical protein ACREUZ_14765 [Burkholderiales bacterium]